MGSCQENTDKLAALSSALVIPITLTNFQDLKSPTFKKIFPHFAEVESVRAEWTVAQSKLTEFSSTVTDLETKLGRDYGPDDVFVALADECFEVPVKQ